MFRHHRRPSMPALLLVALASLVTETSAFLLSGSSSTRAAGRRPPPATRRPSPVAALSPNAWSTTNSGAKFVDERIGNGAALERLQVAAVHYDMTLLHKGDLVRTSRGGAPLLIAFGADTKAANSSALHVACHPRRKHSSAPTFHTPCGSTRSPTLADLDLGRASERDERRRPPARGGSTHGYVANPGRLLPSRGERPRRPRSRSHLHGENKTSLAPPIPPLSELVSSLRRGHSPRWRP